MTSGSTSRAHLIIISQPATMAATRQTHDVTTATTMNEATSHNPQETTDATSNPEDDDDGDFLIIKESESFDQDDDHDEEAREAARRRRARFIRKLGWLSLHGFCVLLYLLPTMLLPPHPDHQGRPVLDEMHIVSADNRDVNDASVSLHEIFTNDYWGRPMNASNSHKSWRPLSILSFRFLKGGRLFTDLSAHRLVNIVTHAAVAELVSLLAVKLFPMHVDPVLLRVMTKLLFILHPTHVEVTANAANRPHLLAVLCSVWLCDPDLNPFLLVLALVLGYLSCETFLFQVPAAGVTLAAVVYLRLYHGPRQLRKRGTKWTQLKTVLRMVWWRLFLLLSSGVAYVAFRHWRDWLSIPEGLIRPAENPFYEFVGVERLRNYLFVVAVQ